MKRLLLLVCIPICTAAVLGQIRIYPLDGNAVEIVSGLDGTLGTGTAEPVNATDRFGNTFGAMYFDGDDQIEIPVIGLTTNEFSVSAWLLVSVNPASLQMDYYAVGDNVQDQAYGVANDGFGQGFFQAGYVDVGGPMRVFAGALPTENIWYHVVVTRSLTDLKLFVNGSLVTTTDATGTLPVYGVTPLAFIGNRNVNQRPWNGMIDDLRIWDEAIPDSMVQVINAVPEGVGSNPIILGPNPCSSLVQLSGLEIGDRVTLHNSLGMEVLATNTANATLQLDISDLSKGAYVLVIRSQDRVQVIQLIKQ